MSNVLGYYVFDSETGQWLADDEKTWTVGFHQAAEFARLDLANDIMAREGGDYVLACMASP